MNLSLSQIAAAVGGRLIGPDTPVTGPVVTDSRQASPGALFVAVHGERTDGHAPGWLSGGILHHRAP